MVAFSDLTQVMQNARTDAKTLDEYVHGAADTKVTSRLGKQYWTLATLDNKLSLVKIKAEKTLADIDTLAKSATDSITAKSNSANTTIDNKATQAISYITAKSSSANAMLDSKAAQANNDIAAKVASANTAIDTQVASIDTRADSEIANLQSAINTAATAGAGANGWTALLVQDASGKSQQEINNATIQSVETVADLLFIAKPVHKQVVNVKRFSGQSQYVGGQLYTFDATSTDADNGFETLAVSGVNGRWKANFANNVINVHNVGYIADNTTDNSNVHQKVSAFLNTQTKSFEIVFSDGVFLFNQKHNRFWLTSNTKYTVKPTATIKGGIAFDDDIVNFASQFDASKPLMNVEISGGGTFDMSDTGYMKSKYSPRLMFYIYNPINLVVDGCIFKGGDFSHVFSLGERETNTTAKNIIIRNNIFDIPVSDNPASKNTDFTAIYVQAKNTLIQNNKFIANNIRAKCLATATEFHIDDGIFDNNTIINLAVGLYIAQAESLSTNNIKVTNNKGTLSNLFVGFWSVVDNKTSPETRYANDIFIANNDIKQWSYPDLTTLKANGLFEKQEGLRFIGFINSDGMTAGNLTSNGIHVVNNTFTHVNNNPQCSLLHLFTNAAPNIYINNNVLKVNALFTTADFANKGIENINISKNVIESNYLSSTLSPINLNVASTNKCVFDLSDIQYKDFNQKSIPIITFATNTSCTLTTIIEGETSRRVYAQLTYPSNFYDTGLVNTSARVFSTALIIPATSTGGIFVCATSTSTFESCTKAKIIYCGEHLDASFVLPDTLTKRAGDPSGFVGYGYSETPITETRNYQVWFYIS